MVLIGDILDFKNGLNKGKEYFGYGTPIVNYTDVYHHSGLYAPDIKGRVSLSKDEIKRFEVRKNDVFFTRTSETPEEVGLSAVLLEDITDCAFSGFVLRGRPKNDMLVPEYCKYCFSAKAFREKIISNCTYTTRALTNGRVLSAIEIPVPSKDEQLAIASALTDMERHIANLAELIEKKKAIRDGALEDLVSGKIRLPGFDYIWEDSHIGQILKILHGKNQHEVESPSGHYPIMGTGGVIGKATTYLCDWECVLIGRKGTIDQPYYMNTPFWTIDTLYYSRPAENQCVKFQYYLFCTINWYDYTESSGRPSLTRKAIEGIEIKLPKYEEQKAIADVLTTMDVEIKDLEDERDKMIQIREGAMDDLLTGRVRLTV